MIGTRTVLPLNTAPEVMGRVLLSAWLADNFLATYLTLQLINSPLLKVFIPILDLHATDSQPSITLVLSEYLRTVVVWRVGRSTSSWHQKHVRWSAAVTTAIPCECLRLLTSNHQTIHYTQWQLWSISGSIKESIVGVSTATQQQLTRACLAFFLHKLQFCTNLLSPSEHYVYFRTLRTVTCSKCHKKKEKIKRWIKHYLK